MLSFCFVAFAAKTGLTNNFTIKKANHVSEQKINLPSLSLTHSYDEKMNKTIDCIFCKISQGTSPCHKVWENDHYLAFLSIYPNTPGITVVIPKTHQSSYLFDQSDEDMLQLMQATKAVANILVKKLDTVGRVAVVFEGYGVNHLHAKLYPLHGTKGPWREIKSTIHTRYERYPGYISSHDSFRESEEKLAALAKQLRGENY
ncbi:MAG: HIT family protein [Bacteroidota bacterium]